MSLKYGELFGGIGAWGKALKNLGIASESVFTIEFDEKIMSGYNAIHGTNYEPSDITKVDETKLPDCDIIFFSPPCQAFSRAGKELGFDDKRGILFFEALRVIKHKQPKYAIMENVKGLTGKKFETEFKAMLKELEDAGYTNYWKVVNAKDLNFPQNRERVFVISIRNDIDQSYEFPTNQPLTANLNDYLDLDADNIILHNIYGGFKETNARVFEGYSPTIRTSAGGGHIPSVLIKEVYKLAFVNDINIAMKNRKRDTFLKSYRSVRKGLKVAHKIDDKYYVEKMDYREFIIANPDKILEKDYFLLRQMTAYEAFRLMGYTQEDFHKARRTLNSSYHNGKDKADTQLYKMAGNSIVVKVIEELLKGLLTDGD